MKQILLTTLLLIGLTVCAADKTKAPPGPVAAAETIIWAGLDYSMVRMYGTSDFQSPESIFPAMLNNWNGLFIQELILHKSERLQKALGKPVKVQTEGITERNQLAKPDQVIRQDGVYSEETHIKDTDIAAAVKSYKMTATEGVALVFIVDRLVKVEQKGAVYLVFFDVATRQVLLKERVVVKAGGMGFRNYWFRVVKDALPALKKLR